MAEDRATRYSTWTPSPQAHTLRYSPQSNPGGVDIKKKELARKFLTSFSHRMSKCLYQFTRVLCKCEDGPFIIGGIYFFPPEIQNLGRGALLPKQQWRIIGRAHELLHHDDTMTMRCCGCKRCNNNPRFDSGQCPYETLSSHSYDCAR